MMNKQHISAEFFNYIIRKIAKQFLAAKYKTLWPLVKTHPTEERVLPKDILLRLTNGNDHKNICAIFIFR